MTDKYRIAGKTDSALGEPLYLLEIELSRKVLVTRGDMFDIFAMLDEGNQDGGWNDIIAVIKSGFNDDIPSKDIPLIQSPWLPANFSNKNIRALFLALESQDGDFAVHESGSPDSGGVTFTAVISGRQYSRTVRSSAEAKAFASDIEKLHETAKEAGWGKSIKVIANAIDWALRVAGAYELAEKAWNDIAERIRAEKERQAFEHELKANIDRSRHDGIDRAREMEAADRFNRTA